MKRVLVVLSALSCVMLLALSFFLSSASAQLVPRTVLMEEGTNWSCGPCALANPGIDSFITAHAGNLIHLAYHPNWPGADDPMYLNDETDNQYRVQTYYGINGVPDVLFDGMGSFNPGQGMRGYYEALWSSRIATLSPIALTITRTVSGSTVNLHVTVTAVGDISAYSPLYLRVAGVETRMNVRGPNGEPYYDDPMRTMLPNYQGTALTMAQGDTKSFDFSYPIKSAYVPAHLYEVAFVQTDNSTHEVLQAASTKFVAQTLLAKSGTQILGRVATPATLSFTLSNNATTDGQFTIKFTPNSLNPWTTTLTASGNSGNPLTVTIPAGQSIDVVLAATVGASGYTSGMLSAVRSNDGTSSVLPVKMIAPDTKLAFVDVYGDSATAMQSEVSLTGLTERYAKLSGQEAVQLGAWSPTEYPEIVLGAGKWIVSDEDKTGMKAYLAAGGHLLIHGGEIAYGLADGNAVATNDKAFLFSTLHASYVKDSAGPLVVHGVAGDIVSGATSGSINIYSSTTKIGEVNQPDQITVASTATPIYYYGTGTSQAAGLRYYDAATHEKLVYTAFGLENLSAQDESTILASSLKWFRMPAGVNENAVASQFTLQQNYPNPFNPVTQISFTLDKSGPVSMYLYDAKGAIVRELVNSSMEPGSHSVALDASALPSGTYFYVLRSGAQMLRRAMTLLK